MLPIDRLLLVAAPSCCGKTTFINAVRAGDLETLAGTLDFRESDGWLFKDAWYLNHQYLDKLRNAPESRLVLHWTIPRPSFKLAVRGLATGYSYDKRHRVDFVRSARKLTIVTLLNSREYLLRGVNSRLTTAKKRHQSGTSNRLTFLRQKWNMSRLTNLYSDMSKVVPMYDRWFGFCESLNASAHHIVRLDQGSTLVDLDGWLELRGRWLSGDDD